MAACTTANDPLADQSFITGQPCAAPCWYGLELGKSTKAETLALLPTLAFVDPASINEKGTAWGGDDTARAVLFGCIHPRIEYCGIATFSGDKLRDLWLSIHYELPLTMAISKLGQPTFADYGILDPQGCAVDVYWPDQSISARLGGVGQAECPALQTGKGLSADFKLTEISYTEGLTLPVPSDAWSTRINWPGFSAP